MTTSPQIRNAFLAPAAESAPSPTRKPIGPGRRQATVYDAVAGRCTRNQLILPGTTAAKKRRPSIILAPESVLFRRVAAPERYEESDFYFADENLPGGVTLPDSDLLKALHTYASDFYAAKGGIAVDGNALGRGRVRRSDKGLDFRSLDETALLALGVLMEELAVECLGEGGDLVFTESETADEPGAPGEPTEQQEEAAAQAETGIPVETLKDRKKRRKSRTRDKR